MRSLGRDDSGLEQFFGIDGDRYVLRTTFDNEPVIERNKALQTVDGFGKGDDMQLVASIPVGVQFEWLSKHGVNMWDRNHEPAVKRLLNSSDYRYLRVREIIL